MSTVLNAINKRFSIFLLAIIILSTDRLSGQNISFGVFAEPVISWFSTNTSKTKNSGSLAGLNFGLTFNKYFSKNYAFSTGINILNAGGRLNNPTKAIKLKFDNPPDTIIQQGESVAYKIQYLSIPVGLKFKSNQIGYITFFSDFGIDPKFAIGGKVDVPYLNIKGEAAMDELNKFNLSYHVMAGIEYSLGGSTSILLGLGYENNFLDVTKDISIPPYNQPIDKVTQNILKFRFGVNF
jgi:hypothetical protein